MNSVLPCGQKDGQTNMTKVRVAFRNFRNSVTKAKVFSISSVSGIVLGKSQNKRVTFNSIRHLTKDY